jgi:hypothetical protein
MFDLHPLLRLVAIPGSGRGYCVTGGRVRKGEVLLTESAFCAGELRNGGGDRAMVAQFMERVHADEIAAAAGAAAAAPAAAGGGGYTGGLKPTELTTSDGEIAPCGGNLLDKAPHSAAAAAAWVQRCLDNNVYQCRREPRQSALFLGVARFNHSCDPSALNDADRAVARVRALRDLADGEEVTMSYVPVGWDLAARAAALRGYGFRCRCARCARERACDPAFSTPCGECGAGVRSMVVLAAEDATGGGDVEDCTGGSGSAEADDSIGDDGGGEDPFAARAASPCTVCGSSSPFAAPGSPVAARHAGVLAASAAVQGVLAAWDPAKDERRRVCRQAETALLLAPFATHRATLRLHRGLVRLLQAGAQPRQDGGDGSSGNGGYYHRKTSGVVLEQLREIERLDKAHGGARHRDLHFLRRVARVKARCSAAAGGAGADAGSSDAGAGGGSDDSDTDDDDAGSDAGVLRQLRAHVTARWRALCLTHFGESAASSDGGTAATAAAAAAPASFLEWACAEEEEGEGAVRWVPIGTSGERLALLDGDDEISLSGYGIGDAGCAVLCSALAGGIEPALRSLDLESNRLSAAGGASLGAALAAGAAPLLAQLDLIGNDLGTAGACALAAALAPRTQQGGGGGGCCPLLAHLDFQGNGIGDAGCAALGAAFAAGAAPLLAHLYLTSNGIEDCSALAALFGGVSPPDDGAPGRRRRRCLVHLDLAQNLIEDCSCLFSTCNRGTEEAGGSGGGGGGQEDGGVAVASSLTHLDASWNCIDADGFEALRRALLGGLDNAKQPCAPTLGVLLMEGNALSDRQCAAFCAACKLKGADGGASPEIVRAGGAPPEGGEKGSGGVAAADADAAGDDDQKLRRCLQSLASGEAVNPRVSGAEELWQAAAAPVRGPPSAGAAADAPPTGSGSNTLSELLERDGFAVAPRLFERNGGGGAAGGGGMAALSATVDRLESAGWPPVFCFMCDVVWDIICGPLWDKMEALLGTDCVLEPSVFAWSLKRTGGGASGAGSSAGGAGGAGAGQLAQDRKTIGQSFGLPHRDYPASEALFADGPLAGAPKLLNAWIPLNDATPSNGCMHVVPREFDGMFARAEDPAHMRPAAEVRGGAVCKLRFGLHGARALPAPAGSLLLWYGNTIHWGGSCSRHAEAPPRKSIAMVFRRGDVAQLEGSNAGPPLTRAAARGMSPDARLSLVARSLLLYQQWHSLHAAAVPPAIYEVTSRW